MKDTGICSGCGKELRIPFPYNVDLARNDVIVICSRCGLHLKIKFIEERKWGRIQGVFRPPYIPNLEEMRGKETR